jgi:hypothetical protein
MPIIESKEVPSGTVLAYILANDSNIQFTGGSDGLNGPLGVNHYSGAHSGVAVGLAIANGQGVVDVFNSVSTITLTATGGTAPKINGQSGPVVVPLLNGVATVTVSDSAPGTVSLAMSAPTHPSNILALDSAVVVLS